MDSTENGPRNCEYCHYNYRGIIEVVRVRIAQRMDPEIVSIVIIIIGV